MTEPRRGRGCLEADVKAQVDLYASGALRIKGNKPLTPYRIAVFIKDHDVCEKLPSSGSITSILKGWAEIGFINTTTNPFAFASYTPEGMKLGLAAMKAAAAEAVRRSKVVALATDLDASLKTNWDDATLAEARKASMARHPTAGYSADGDDYIEGAGDRPPLGHVFGATYG